MRVAVVITAALFAQQAALSQQDWERTFTVEVRPLLAEKCFACHGGGDLSLGGLDLTSREAMLAGGTSKAAVLKPGQAQGSLLYKALTWDDVRLRMPPKENDRLSREQVWKIRDWINAGAPWPDEETQEAIRVAEREREVTDQGVLVKLSGALSDDWLSRRYKPRNLWAYLPIEPTPAPVAGHPVDALVDEGLRQREITAAPEADPRTLIRRITFDLTGLPPTAEEIRHFLQAWERSPSDAYAQLVDRLLASPHYGERQAQYWLDVTRYADTSGGSNDFERSGVWRYRDYVVRSFNADKPYDQFVLEQIAGDELAPGDSEAAIAVGFLRMGPWEATNMNPPAVVRLQFLDDVVNHVGEVFLGQPLRCAKCHDHKFDPIPTRDYYSIMAAFGETNQAEIEAPFLPDEVAPDGTTERERVDREVKLLNTEIDRIARKRFDAGIDWLREQGVDASGFEFKEGGGHGPYESLFRSLPEEQRPPKNIGLTAQEITILAVLPVRRKHFQRFLQRFEPVAYTVYTGPPNDYFSKNDRNAIPESETELKNDPVHILTGGSLESPGERVSAGALSCVESLARHPFAPGQGEGESERLHLARWIADANNPLTARVIANRIWQQHFSGKGIVATPSNFGSTGAKPSNPKLLDFLAGWLVDNDWSIKKLHRLIVTSETYRRSARHSRPEMLSERDPDGASLAAYPPRRLHAEKIRDAMLSATGELNLAVGGTPVFPEINLEAAMQPRYLQTSVGPAYQPSPFPQDRHRRTLYAFRMRGLSNPFLEVFNKPSADLSCEWRDSTTVTPQVFSLLNGQQPHDRALALARRLEGYSTVESDRIHYAYELVYGRPALNVPLGTGQVDPALIDMVSAEAPSGAPISLHMEHVDHRDRSKQRECVEAIARDRRTLRDLVGV